MRESETAQFSICEDAVYVGLSCRLSCGCLDCMEQIVRSL